MDGRGPAPNAPAPLGVRVIACLCFLGGVTLLIPAARSFFDGDDFWILVAFVCGGLSFVCVAIGLGLWRLQNAARIATLILIANNVLGLAFVKTGRDFWVPWLVVHGGIFLYLLRPSISERFRSDSDPGVIGFGPGQFPGNPGPSGVGDSGNKGTLQAIGVALLIFAAIIVWGYFNH